PSSPCRARLLRARSTGSSGDGATWGRGNAGVVDRGQLRTGRGRHQCRAACGSDEQRALVLQQPALAVEAAAIAGERAVLADHAVAGHDDRDRIAAVDHADRAHRVGTADGLCELAVAPGGAGRNPAQRRPYLPLEHRAAAVDGNVVESREVAAEIGAKAVAN